MCADSLVKGSGSSDPSESTVRKARTRMTGGTAALPVLLTALSVVAAAWIAPDPLAAQVPNTENTLRLEDDDTSLPARIDQFSFLQGEWTGEGLGGEVDELWSRPASGTMVGAFRLIREGRVVFYEIFALEEEEGTVVLRLKHFDPGPGLPGWEERDRETLFRLVRVEGNVAWFRGLTFRLADPDTLLVHLALRSGDGPLREEVFHFSRIHR